MGLCYCLLFAPQLCPLERDGGGLRAQEAWRWRGCGQPPAAPPNLSNVFLSTCPLPCRASLPTFPGIVPWKMPKWPKTFWTHRFGKLGAVFCWGPLATSTYAWVAAWVLEMETWGPLSESQPVSIENAPTPPQAEGPHGSLGTGRSRMSEPLGSHVWGSPRSSATQLLRAQLLCEVGPALWSPGFAEVVQCLARQGQHLVKGGAPRTEQSRESALAQTLPSVSGGTPRGPARISSILSPWCDLLPPHPPTALSGLTLSQTPALSFPEPQCL